MAADLGPGHVPTATPAGGSRPPGPLARLVGEERRAWREHYRRRFAHAARALGLGFVAGFLLFTVWPSGEAKALALVARALEDIRLDAAPLVLVLTLFWHNARASAVAVAAGLVPFLCLPILDPFVNGAVLGLLVSIAKHQGLDVPRLVATQILPHGVFELAAVLYATSLGLYLSAEMGKKARAAWRARTGTGTGTCTLGTCPPSDPCSPFGSEPAAPECPVRNVVRSFVLVVLPLLLAAALVEGLVTPRLR